MSFLRAAFGPQDGSTNLVSQTWATWSPESGGTRYDVLLTPISAGAFGRTSGSVVAICGTPGVRRVAFLVHTTDKIIAPSYLRAHLNDVGNKPFSTTDLYRLTEMVAALLGREAHLPDHRYRLREGDSPFVVPE